MVKQSEGITEGKVLGGFIMAATEYERAYQNQDSKQILFARDLAPSYDFTTTAGTLDATAYGNGTVSYQWYKSDGTNETKIADATSATYTPTESGSYYCIATANGNTIKTSETTVTAKSNSNTDNGSTDNNGGSENGETTTIFSLSVNTGANASVAKQNELSLAEYATITGGSASVYNGKGSAQNMIVNGSITYTDKSTQYVKITLNKALTKGDVITIATSGSKIYAAKDNSGNITNNIAKSPYTVDDNLAGATVLYLSSGDKGKTISSITITRPVKKYTVSATAGTGGSVTIANASGATVTSDTEVEANTSLTFTATPSDGYVFVNWTDASNKEVSTNATYTRTVTAAISLTANFKAKTPVDPTESGVKPVFLESFKGITINLNQDSKNRTITVPLIHDGEDVSSYFKYTYTITPTGNTSSVTGSTLNFTPETAGTYTVTVSATPDSDGTDDYSDVYDNPEPIIFTLKVDSKNQTISVTPDPTSIKMYAGTTRVAPDLTVKTETTTLDDTEYNTLWFSTSPGIVKVDANTGEIEAVSEGTAKIRVVVTGDNLESTTALITVEVDDPAMYRVKGSGETYKNHTRMWNQDKNMSVVLGGWLFSDDVKEIVETPNTSSEGLSAKYHWGPGASKAKWKLTGFDYYVAGDNNKNARQENGSNALPETTNIYSADFVKYKGTIKDNMFNVPCSGSYLEFNPVTNGKVTVHIFQNGAFDAKTTTKMVLKLKNISTDLSVVYSLWMRLATLLNLQLISNLQMVSLLVAFRL